MKISSDRYKKILINLLKYIDDICRENKINYSLIGGSLIGAIRENGIIPWDDDVDIILMKDDYDKLMKILEKNQHKTYRLFHHKTNASYYYPFAKLVDTNTLVEEKDVLKIDHYGIYIDIFTYNYVPNNSLFRKIHYYILSKIKRFISISVHTNNNSKNKFKMFAYKIIEKIGYKRLVYLYNKVFNLYSKKKNGKYIVSNWPAYGYHKEIQKSKNFKEFIDYEFSGITVRISKNYDQILTTTFGNYIIPVKPKDNKTSHDIEAYFKK